VPNTGRTDGQQRTEGGAPGLSEQVADTIRRHRAGDRAAMTDLVVIVSPWLRAVGRGFGLSQYSAEDVAQATLLALVCHIDRIRNPDAGLEWLAVTARREAIKVARAERAVTLGADVGSDEADPTMCGPEAIAMETARRNLLWRHVDDLPARGRLILHEIAHGGDRPDYAALARRSEMPLGSIGPTRMRSLATMRTRLGSDREWLACA
jgi:DNA-directed RNA polymerase specialized sigma24 family protein